MGNAAPVKRKQTEAEKLMELAEQNFQKANEFLPVEKTEGISIRDVETKNVAPETNIPPKPKIDWDNIEPPPQKPQPQKRKTKVDGNGKEKITSVSQMKWKHDQIEEVTVYDAMGKFDKQLQQFEKEQDDIKKEEEKVKKEELEAQKQAREDEKTYNSNDDQSGRFTAKSQRSDSLLLDEDGEVIIDPLEEEENALYDLFNATQPWKECEGWNNNTEIKDWYGITCDAPQPIPKPLIMNEQSEEDEDDQNDEEVIMADRGYVRRLYLDHNFVEACDLPTIGWNKFLGLKILSLSHNHLKGTIPIEIAECTKLQVLNLSCNKLQGEVPTEFNALSALTHLWLYANQLSGSFPQDILSSLGCTSLVSLRVKRNQFTGAIPPGIGNLERLEEIDIEENQFNGNLPDSLSKLTKLRVLRVAKNELSGSLPVRYLESMTTLKDIRFYHNKFDQHAVSKMGVMRTVSHSGALDFY